MCGSQGCRWPLVTPSRPGSRSGTHVPSAAPYESDLACFIFNMSDPAVIREGDGFSQPQLKGMGLQLLGELGQGHPVPVPIPVPILGLLSWHICGSVGTNSPCARSFSSPECCCFPRRRAGGG